MIRSLLSIKIVILLSLAIGTWHLASASWIVSKAYAATFLINDAWQATLMNNKINKPWTWADTWPVGNLSIPSIDLNEIVLSGDSGASLAFGPGLSQAGAALDEDGIKLISAHRDTHFHKLQNISINDEILIKTSTSIRQYKVRDIRIVDSRAYSIDTDDTDYELVLATCYPFSSISVGGSKRFIILASKIQ